MSKIGRLVSFCCNVPVHAEGAPDFIGDDSKAVKICTVYYVCDKCGRACDVEWRSVAKAIRRPRRDKMMKEPETAK